MAFIISPSSVDLKPLFSGIGSSATRNDFNGWVGFRVIFNRNMYIRAFARYDLPTNSGSKPIGITSSVANQTTTLALYGLTDYSYVPVATSYLLPSGTALYCASRVSLGDGVLWYDQQDPSFSDSSVVTSCVNAGNAAVGATIPSGGWFTGPFRSYVPMNLQFEPA